MLFVFLSESNHVLDEWINGVIERARLVTFLQRFWPGAGNAILADTVGFIRELPHDLISAFRATLQETHDAELLVHVVDAHDQNRAENMQQVKKVLSEIDADGVPVLLVFNKLDLLEDGEARIDYAQDGKPSQVWVSAKTGEGIPGI